MSDDPLRQISLRLPESAIAAIDERRKPLGISRDKWLLRASIYCLSLPVKEQTP